MNSKIFLILSLISVCTSVDFLDDRFSCLDHNQTAVDWFVILLFANSTSPSKSINYAYTDSTMKEFKFFAYNKANFPPLRMANLLDLNQKNKSFNHFFWNDDDSSSVEKITNKENVGRIINSDHILKETWEQKAHSKGFIAYDTDGGYLVSHSLPQFPIIDNVTNIVGSDLPNNSGAYSQHFVCVSVDKENMYGIISQLNIIIPNLYNQVLEDNVDTPGHPEVLKLIKNKYSNKKPNFDQALIKSREGVIFDIFSKGRNNTVIPWDLQIPLYYNTSFLVETWTRPQKLPNVCNLTSQNVNVFNVLRLNFEKKFQFGCGNEHSKWGVSISPVSNREVIVVCFGDLNRTTSQKLRTGVTICFKNRITANFIRKAVVDYEKCL